MTSTSRNARITAEKSKVGMTRRLIGCAGVVCLLAILAAGLGMWQLRVPKPAKPRLGGELKVSRIVVDGRQRTFVYYVAPRLRPNPPLLLVLHGSMMSGLRMREAT